MSLSGDGILPVTNSMLGVWSAEGLTADYYTVRLRVDKTAFTNESTTYLYLEPDLYSENWPQWVASGPVGGVLPARDPEGRTRLILMTPQYSGSSKPIQVWSFGLDGTHQSSSLQAGNYMGFAVANVDGQMGDEVIVQDYTSIDAFPAPGGPRVTSWNANTELRYTL
jgi:hypothetical protein